MMQVKRRMTKGMRRVDRSEYESVDALVFTSDRQAIVKRDRAFVDALRRGTALPTGRPEVYYIEPQPDQTMDLTFYPTPTTGETVSGLVSVLPAAWGTGATTAPTMPRMVVRTKPEGSFGPGEMNFARTPARKPMMIVQMMVIAAALGLE